MIPYRDELGRFAKKPTEELPIEGLPKLLSSSSAPSSSSSNSTHSLTLASPKAMSQHEDNPQKTMMEYLHPTRMATPSCIMLPSNAPQLDFKPGMIQLLPTFHGLENENPYVHIREFEEVVATFHSRADAINSIRLKFFPFSLKDKAKLWLNSLRPRSIGSWEEMTVIFFKKYFPHNKTNGLKRQISTFSQKEGETLTQAWDRFEICEILVPTVGTKHGALSTIFTKDSQCKSACSLRKCATENFSKRIPTRQWST